MKSLRSVAAASVLCDERLREVQAAPEALKGVARKGGGTLAA